MTSKRPFLLMRASRVLALGALGAVSLTLGGCGSLFSHDPSFTDLRGSVTYTERMALPPEATIIIQLTRDSTNPKAEVVAEERLHRAGQVPIHFDLRFDSRLVKDGHQYFAKATILENGRIIFESKDAAPVLGGKLDVNVELLVVPVEHPDLPDEPGAIPIQRGLLP